MCYNKFVGLGEPTMRRSGIHIKRELNEMAPAYFFAKKAGFPFGISEKLPGAFSTYKFYFIVKIWE